MSDLKTDVFIVYVKLTDLASCVGEYIFHCTVSYFRWKGRNGARSVHRYNCRGNYCCNTVYGHSCHHDLHTAEKVWLSSTAEKVLFVLLMKIFFSCFTSGNGFRFEILLKIPYCQIAV